jgi:hypothetical protein
MIAMTPDTSHRWSVLSRLFKAIGAIGCVGVFLWLAFLIGYYTARRPHVPQPEQGWTVGLTWTHPTSYGSAQEESRMIWWHGAFLAFFGLAAVGEMINIYKLDDYSGIARHFRKKPYFKPR